SDTRDARELAAAVRAARDALRGGATSMGGARTTLLGLVNDARLRGFTVGGDGSVTPPPVPPVMYGTEPGAAEAAQRTYDASVARVEAEAQGIADAVSGALTEAAAADTATAEALAAVQVPQGLREKV
ncbi:hypothetical protein G9H71_13515, partial [Motilibacter sp. E257]